MYMGLRRMKSDVVDRVNRPDMLNSDSTPTKPAAADAATADVSPVRKKSWIIGAACSRMPMPAVTLQNSTTHSSQNCGVFTELRAETLSVVTSAFCLTVDGSKPSGRQPSAGTRTMNAPNIMNTRYRAARVRKRAPTAVPVGTEVLSV